MSVRIVNFEMDGVVVKLASMTWRQAERFVEEGRELLKKREEAPEGAWLQRTLRVVAESMKAAGVETDADKLQDEFDIPTMNAMNFKVLEISGLRATTSGPNGAAQGESKAAPISEPSAVA